jgi:hypothetical protein
VAGHVVAPLSLLNCCFTFGAFLNLRSFQKAPVPLVSHALAAFVAVPRLVTSNSELVSTVSLCLPLFAGLGIEHHNKFVTVKFGTPELVRVSVHVFLSFELVVFVLHLLCKNLSFQLFSKWLPTVRAPNNALCLDALIAVTYKAQLAVGVRAGKLYWISRIS